MQTLNEDPLLRAGVDSIASFVREGAFGTFTHQRELPEVHHQTVVRMSRDTLCSAGVFDLEAGAVTVRLPDTQGRFMSLLAINEKHQPLAVFNDSEPVKADFTGAKLGMSAWHRAKCVGTILRDTDLTYVDFTKADLTGADFRGAKQVRVHLHGTKLDGTIFTSKAGTLEEDPALSKAERHQSRH